MGVDFSKQAARPPLSIGCVAEITQLDAVQFQTFRKAIRAARSPTRRHSTTWDITDTPAVSSDEPARAATSAWRTQDLTGDALGRALDVAEIEAGDCSIVERMFILMDRTGDDVVHSLELLIASALLVRGSFAHKLELAVACLLADLQARSLTPTHLLFLVSTMTTVANYFGDPLLPLPVLEGIADDAFQELRAASDLDASSSFSSSCVDDDRTSALLVHALSKHPIVQEYVSPGSTVWTPRHDFV